MIIQANRNIRIGWLIDGTGNPIQKDMVIRITNGLIDEIVPYQSHMMTGDLWEDLSNCTIIPPLIDAHVHLFMSGTTDQNIRKHQLDAEFENICPIIETHIRDHLSYGVVAVRDGGDKKGHTLRYKKTCLNHNTLPITIKAAGKAWHKPGRYGTIIGQTPFNGCSLAKSILINSENGDHIKIVNSGINSLLCFGKETSPQFDVEELQSAVRVAKQLGLKTMIHANGKEPVRAAIEAGCDSIEHGFLMGTENLKKMAERQIYWVPTACTMKAYSECIPQQDTRSGIAKKYLDHQIEQLFQAKKFGVPVLVGTDAGSMGVFHGSGMIDEFNLFLEAGFSIQEAIRWASIESKKLLGIDRIGELTRHHPASFIALKGSPDTFPESMSQIQCMYIDGIPINH